jgi:hypothetical protein
MGYNIIKRGTIPYMRDFAIHGVASCFGTFCAAELADKVCAESYYNGVLM